MDSTSLPLDHVGIAVPSIDDAMPLYELLTGGEGSARERIEEQGVDVAFVGSGDGRVELLEPLRDDSAVGRFLARRGPGLHHVAYRVTDIEAELRRLTDAGLDAIDEVARPGAFGHRVAFLHPKSTGGVLIELVEHSGE